MTQQYNDIIVAGDFNKDIHSEYIKEFFRTNSLKDTHSMINSNSQHTDYTQLRGSKCINSIAMSTSLLDYIIGDIMIETNKITTSDHQGYIIDLNLEEYFQQNTNRFDNINFEILSLSRKIHKE